METYRFIWWCILSLIFLIITVYSYIHRDEPDRKCDDFPPFIFLTGVTLFTMFLTGLYFVS